MVWRAPGGYPVSARTALALSKASMDPVRKFAIRAANICPPVQVASSVPVGEAITEDNSVTVEDYLFPA